MSTNIEIDVVLQKLKKISDETAAQNRSEKKEREELQELPSTPQRQTPETIKGDFNAKNEFVINAARTVRESLKAGEESSAVPNLYKKKRPAAQRLSDYGILAAKYSTRRQGNTLFVKVQEPISGVSVEVQTVNTGRGSVTTPPAQDDPSIFTAYGRVYRYKENLEWAIYRNGSFGGGTNFSDRLATPPRTSNQTDIRYTVSKRSADRSNTFVLPISVNEAVFVYVQNEFEVYNTYQIAENKVYQSVNERNIGVDSETLEPYEWGDPGYSADWDATGHTRITYTLQGQTTFSAYEVLCFYVAEGVVKKISTPAPFLQKIQELMPPVGVNSTAPFFKQIDLDRYYAHNFNTFVDVIDSNYTQEFQNEPAFSDAVWRQSSRYGNVPDQNTVLARHFGLGLLNTNSHGDSSFFTPAVFTYISGPMDLSTSSTREYGYMRSEYYMNAPRDYFAPCARLGSCTNSQVVEFDSARVSSPLNITTPIPSSSFARSRKTDAYVGEEDDSYSVVYSWNWGLDRYCRTRLTSLGFSPADLRP